MARTVATLSRRYARGCSLSAQTERETAFHVAEAALQRQKAQRERARKGSIAALVGGTIFGVLIIIGQLLPKMDIDTNKDVFAEFQAGADHGDATSMWNLGVLYANGQGVAQDYAKAREWYQKAVDKGSADAMYKLGNLYDDGQGVAQDYAKAREWYQKAADKGSAEAMFTLGLHYDYGQGVAQDFAKAREWYEKAADKGDASAKVRLQQLPIR